jgi:hypothetical protein
VFGCACYPNLSAKAAHKLALQSTRCVFLRDSTDHKGYQCLDLTTNNIVISWHVVFDEAGFPLSVSSHLTNDLDILLQDDSPDAAPMPAPLPVPHVPPGFPPLAAAGGQTARSGGQTVPGTEAGGQTTPRTEVGSQTVSLGGQTAPGTKAGSPTTQPFVAP